MTIEETQQLWALVTAAQAGDRDAFAALYSRYHRVVFRYVMFRTRSWSLAEDLTSDTFTRALRRLNSVTYQGRDPGAWFITIARNLVLDHAKAGARRETPRAAPQEAVERPSWDRSIWVLTLEAPSGRWVNIPEPRDGGDPATQVADAAVAAVLRRCIGQLNPDQRRCVELRFLRGMSVKETAALLGRNEGAVKALQHRAVRRLAELLPPGLGDAA